MKALFPPEYSANSPTERVDERLSPEMSRPLGGTAVLDRLRAICASAHVPSQARGRFVTSTCSVSNMSHIVTPIGKL